MAHISTYNGVKKNKKKIFRTLNLCLPQKQNTEIKLQDVTEAKTSVKIDKYIKNICIDLL